MLGLNDIGSIFAGKYGLGSVMNEFLIAFDRKRYDDQGLGLKVGDVESDPVEIGNGLIN